MAGPVHAGRVVVEVEGGGVVSESVRRAVVFLLAFRFDGHYAQHGMPSSCADCADTIRTAEAAADDVLVLLAKRAAA